jgi:hypothetical protein
MEDKISLIARFKLLAEKRSKQFAEDTMDMLIAAEAALNGLDAFFATVPIFNKTNIEWVQITYDEDAPESDAVTLSGVLSYEPGSVFHPPGRKPIKVTEDNAGYFIRSLSVSLPIELVTSATEQEVVSYLQARASENMPEALEGGLNDHDEEPEQGPLTERQQKEILYTAKNPEGVFH